MSGERVLAALGPVVDAFARLGVDHHIGGSVATSTFGEARSTLDVGIVAAIAASDWSQTKSVISAAMAKRSAGVMAARRCVMKARTRGCVSSGATRAG